MPFFCSKDFCKDPFVRIKPNKKPITATEERNISK